MSRHAPLVRQLAERLRSRDVSSLVYFHTDHFEPWRPVGGAAAVGTEIVDAIGDFCRVSDRIDFARRLTLFYKPHLNYALRSGADLLRTHPDDLVGFLPRTAEEEHFGSEAMREVVRSSAHDIQVHIHHEYYTATKGHTDPSAIAWFATPLGRSLDPGRLELAIRLNREIIARETGRSTTRWFFVHGHWALNGSDDSSCTITSEIDILLRHGCRGDFTFPAGRAHTNPRIKVPYLCASHDAPKAYDLPECEPEVAYGNAAAAADKFFIWASAASSVQCSLDYMSASSRRQIENTEKAATELLDNAYVAGGQLFIKTHAHSMHPHYFEHARLPVFPHQFPATQTMLSVIFDAASEAGVDVRFLTVPEVYDTLLGMEAGPQVDLSATYLQPAGLFRGRKPATKPRKAKGQHDPIRERTDRPAALEPGLANALVREVVSSILKQRIDSLGIHGSGAHEHYGAMPSRGFTVPASDLKAVEILHKHLSGLDTYHVIGSGIGVLPMLLALNGMPSVGIECDKRRHDAADAILRELSSRPDAGVTPCELLCARFPAAVSTRDPTAAVAILTDFISTQTPQQLAAIRAGLRRYRYLLIDLRRFCVMRDGPDEQAELLRDLSADGFVPIGEPLRTMDCALVLLRNDAVVTKQPQGTLLARLMAPLRRRPGGGAGNATET